jgi:PD-(D/E)XK nuclease superfamily
MENRIMYTWSHSGLMDYLGCPYRFYRGRVLKDIPKQESPALEYGTYVHPAFGDSLTKGVSLPADLRQHDAVVDRLAKWPNLGVELYLAMTVNGEPTQPQAQDAWGRGKLDVFGYTGENARIYDFKTGRKSDHSKPQAESNAMLVFANYPSVQAVKASWNYLKLGVIDEWTFTRGQMPDVYRRTIAVTQRIESDMQMGAWDAKPSAFNCKWCPVADCQEGARFKTKRK